MNAFLATSTAALLVAAASAQQTAVHPSDHANVAGINTESRLPLSNGISRTQIIYDEWDLQVPAGRQITEVGFRQDDGRTSTGVAIQLEIWMGGTDVSSMNNTSVFANNLQNGTTLRKVFGRSIVRLPDLTGTTTQDEFFIPLDSPYTVAANENLVVEYRVFANANANQSFNYFIDRASFLTTENQFGQGCQSSAGTVPQLAGATNSRLGGDLSLNLSQAPANSLIWFNLNVTPTQPVDLGQYGAPGCTALVFPIVNVGMTGSSSGTAFLRAPLPDEPAFAGSSVYGQVLVFDLFANNLGFVASNGVELVLGIAPSSSVCYQVGDPNATTGILRRRHGIVSLFRYQ